MTTNPGNRSLRTQVRPSLVGLEAEWDALVDAAPLPSPFLRSWWLQAAAGPSPRFVLVFDGGALAGGLALEEDEFLRLPRLRTIGHSMGADHLDLVASPNLVDEVIAALGEWFRRPGTRLVDLVGVTADARVAGALPGPVRREVLERAPWSPLPGTLEEYMAQRPSELKNLVNRPLRRLTREGVRHRVVDADGGERALEALKALHAAQWGERSEFLPTYGRFASAARTGIRLGELVVHEFTFEGRVLAVSVFFEVAGRASFYQSGRDEDRRWRGSGTALMALGIGHACDHGCREFDLLRGTEGYKGMWASTSRDVARLRAARGLRARAALLLLPAGSAGRQAGRRIWARVRRRGRGDDVAGTDGEHT